MIRALRAVAAVLLFVLGTVLSSWRFVLCLTARKLLPLGLVIGFAALWQGAWGSGCCCHGRPTCSAGCARACIAARSAARSAWPPGCRSAPAGGRGRVRAVRRRLRDAGVPAHSPYEVMCC
ncbi:hypothetical protein HBB16_20505 [Pseudonocardia sp. MCCB 268]|nr:hypothetical protein [Pseudonocardia cytotoxica]